MTWVEEVVGVVDVAAAQVAGAAVARDAWVARTPQDQEAIACAPAAGARCGTERACRATRPSAPVVGPQ